ncbi:MAG TPA: Gfo/Idh/MocA family oxidoreductase, partial [Geminicoccaceae bacterium]|nr:Gfo/Idh/MocA family oxidoreductase [Geminicoccaceae bacterium]
MAAAPIRVGVLSFAHYHANFWAEVFRDSPLAGFVGVWDDDPERGGEAAAKYGTRVWPDLGDLLAACDAVAVCSATAHHAGLIERAAAAGCHVLCEKPLATTLADCDRIEAAVRGAGVTFMQSFPKRFDPVNHELRRIVQGGEIGRVVFARVRHGHLYGLGPGHGMDWAEDPELAGGGALLDEGVHGADFIRWMFGEPESVVAMVSHVALARPLENLGVAVFRYPDGLLVELAASTTFAAGDNSVEVFGTKGAAVLSGVDLASRDVTEGGFLKVCRLDGGPRRWEVSPMVPRFKTGGFHQQNALRFLEALSAGAPPPNTLEDGRRALEMVLAAYRSARSGRVEPVSP